MLLGTPAIGLNLVPRLNTVSNLDMGMASKISEFPRQRMSVAAILEEYGPQASSSAETFRKVILSSGIRLDEEQTAAVLCLMLTRVAEGLNWNLETVADVLSQDCRGLNWMLIAKSLDNPRLVIRSDSDFLILTKLFLRISGTTISVSGLLATLWNNRSAQFAILALAANAPRSLIDFAPLVSQDQLLSYDGLLTPPNFSWLCLPLYVRLFDLAGNGFAMEVLEVLLKAAATFPEYVVTSLAQVQDQSGVRNELLQRLLPLFTGLPGSRPTYLLVMRRLSMTNLDLLLRLCLFALKKASKVSEVAAIENIAKSLGVQFVRRLESDGTPEDLLGYWCLKADRQEINFEEKLLKLLDLNPKSIKSFVTFLKVHSDNVRGGRSGGSHDAILGLDNFAVFLKICQQYSSLLAPEELKLLGAVFAQNQQSLTAYGQYPAHSQGGTVPREQHESMELSRLPPGPESEEIETVANAYFQKIYTTDISVGDVIVLLKQFKSSADKKDQEVFRCMVHNLFDEYRFFHKYPEKELQITGKFFGSLIQHQLVASITLGIALRYVLEALRKDPEMGEGNDKMFRFGLIALDQFRTRLVEWPQFCSHLVQIPHLSRHSPDLFQEAQRALTNPSQQNPNPSLSSHSPALNNTPSSFDVTMHQPTPSVSYGYQATQIPSAHTPPTQAQFPSPSFLASGGNPTGDTTLNIAIPLKPTSMVADVPEKKSDDLKSTSARSTEIERMTQVNRPISDFPAPPDAVKDQIQFIVNNMAKSNIDSKITELKELLQPEFFGWFATYLVEKRVSSQPNLHPLYLTILDTIDLPGLLKIVLDCTYYNITKYLSSPTITTSSNERSVLRYFGMWLGQITLARNRPLLQRRLDLKSLLLWGYETGRLIAVCTFVAKVVEGVKDSKVFRPPNPWLIAILGVLRELHEIEELKLNIKFEVQVLCKNINVKLEDIKKTNLLGSCQQPIKDTRNPDFNLKNAPIAQSSPLITGNTVNGPQPTQPPIPSPAVQDNLKADSKIDLMPQISTNVLDVTTAINQVLASVVVNSALGYFVTNPNQRRLVAAAVERGIREIIQTAVDKSVAIGTTTTRHLILKDFASDGNELALRNAAHLMVTNLTGSLVVATCREPLRVSIGNHLRTLLAPAISDQTVIEQIVQVCSNDNLDIGCNLIEKVAIEKSLRDMDEILAPSFIARRKAKESGTPHFFDNTVSPAPTRLTADPFDLLKLPSTGLTPAQLLLYDEFPRCRLNNSTINEGKPMPPLAGGINVFSMQQALEANQILFSRLETCLKTLQSQLQGREISLSMLGDHEIIQLLREMVAVVQRTQTGVRNETAITFSESIFARMFDSISQPDPLRLEVIVYILEAIKEACGGAKVYNPDIISWLGKYAILVSNDEVSRKVYRHILILLLRAKLVRSTDVDLYLSIHIDGGRNLFWLEVALSFIKQCLVENLGTVYDYTKTLDAVSKIRLPNIMLKRPLQKWLTDIKALAAAQEEQRLNAGPNSVGGQNLPSGRDTALKEQITLLLDRWMRVWSAVNDQVFGQYLQLMHQCGVLKTEEAADKFFRLSTDICAEACLKSANSTTPTEPSTLVYTVVDALSRLFLLLIRLADKETSDVNVRVNLLNRILNAIVRAIQDEHETRRINKQIFDQRPYFRLLSNLSQDLGMIEVKVEANHLLLPLLTVYTQAYLALQPTALPGFAFAWLQLISKRTFLPNLLKVPKGWPLMHRLILGLIQFFQPFLKLGQLPEPLKKLYKGTLRLFLVLLHDFPEFLCDFHLSFCDAIPLSAVQLRNLVLSAFPRTMRLPDPFTPNLKLDVVADVSQMPKILVDYIAPIAQIKVHIDNYLTHQQPVDLPAKLATLLTSSSNTNNLSLITSLIMYVGSAILSQVQSKGTFSETQIEIFKRLSDGVDAESRYIMFNCMANQLRYPNSHTSLYSTTLLALFLEADSELVQEQIARVLVERLIVHRPHPVIRLLSSPNSVLI